MRAVIQVSVLHHSLCVYGILLSNILVRTENKSKIPKARKHPSFQTRAEYVLQPIYKKEK
jgi:hypothetical protein